MMAVEKKLALADLSKYDEIQRRNNLARDIIKYQNFKAEIAISKINSNGLSRATLLNYFRAGKLYIRDNTKRKNISNSLYEALDTMVAQHVQPLTPSKEEQGKTYNINAKQIVKVSIPAIDTKKPLTEKIEYGVRLDGMIKLFKDDVEANLFIDGAKYAGKDLELLSVVVKPL